MKPACTLAALALSVFLSGCISANESLPWHVMVCNSDDTTCRTHVRASTKRSCEYMREIRMGKDRCELVDCEEPSADITSYCEKQKGG